MLCRDTAFSKWSSLKIADSLHNKALQGGGSFVSLLERRREHRARVEYGILLHGEDKSN